MKILMVDDNPADVRLLREALRERGLPAELHWEASGEAALGRLRATAERPDLVLLDWNLPGLRGCEVLQALKQDAELHRIPVVVLSTSSAPSDVLEAYGGHANAYMVKPDDYANYLRLVSALHQHWFEAVLLPSARR